MLKAALFLLAVVCLSGCASLARGGAVSSSMDGAGAFTSFDVAPVETMLARLPTAYPVERRAFRRPSERDPNQFAILVTAYDRTRWRQIPRRRRRRAAQAKPH